MIVSQQDFHDIIISRKTHYLEIIHNIHSYKIYVSRLRSAMYPHVYYVELCYTRQTSCMVSRLYETSYKENFWKWQADVYDCIVSWLTA